MMLKQHCIPPLSKSSCITVKYAATFQTPMSAHRSLMTATWILPAVQTSQAHSIAAAMSDLLGTAATVKVSWSKILMWGWGWMGGGWGGGILAIFPVVVRRPSL